MNRNSQEKTLLLEVPRHLNDTRLDRALTELLQEKFPEQKPLSRAAVTRAVKAGLVLINGSVAQAQMTVATHDIFTIDRAIFAETKTVQPVVEAGAIEVLFEDEDLLILSKGAGVQMHQAGTQARATVAEWLLSHCPGIATVGEDHLRPGIVHRLDRETSGVVVIAKSNHIFQALKRVFQEREIKKSYLALVYGQMGADEGKIDTALMRSPGTLKRRAIDLEHYTGTLPGNTRSALTYYRVLTRYAEYSLLLVTPKTGRTHQIRVHLSSIGHPVVGDKLYAFKGNKRKNLLFPERHMLHAAELSFTIFGKEYDFQAPLQQDFRDMLQSIDETRVSGYDGEALKSLFAEI